MARLEALYDAREGETEFEKRFRKSWKATQLRQGQVTGAAAKAKIAGGERKKYEATLGKVVEEAKSLVRKTKNVFQLPE
jgi:hypothetical protein